MGIVRQEIEKWLKQLEEEREAVEEREKKAEKNFRVLKTKYDIVNKAHQMLRSEEDRQKNFFATYVKEINEEYEEETTGRSKTIKNEKQLPDLNHLIDQVKEKLEELK